VSERTVADIVAHEVAARVSTVFGLMGNGNAYFVNGVLSEGVQYVRVRHEGASVAAADAHWRSSRAIAVATTTYGPGFTNTVTALAEAAKARVPLVLVVGDAPASGARPIDVDQGAIATAVGVRTITVTDAASARVRTAEAFDLANRDLVPVVLALPSDVAESSAMAATEAGTVESAGPADVADAPAPAPDEIEAVLAFLTVARRPLILGGWGAWLANAGEDLRAAGDQLGALFASSALGRNIFGDTEWDLGIAGGFASAPRAELMAQADVVLVVGASLNPFTSRFGRLFHPDATVAQVDLAETATSPRVNSYLRADAGAFAAILRERTASLPETTGWRADVALPSGDEWGVADAPEHLEDERLDPRVLSAALERLLPEQRSIVLDGGHFVGWPAAFWHANDPAGYLLIGSAYNTIGLGFPSALGAAVARPDRTVVLATGDGGGLMALPDLASAVAAARSLIVVVYNDAAYGAELHQYGSRGLAVEPTLLEQTDFAVLARGMGATGITVRSVADLSALDEWVARGATGTIVLDCLVSPSVIAPFFQEIMSLPH